MTGHYEPDHGETAMERAEREHDARLEREDRRRELGPLPDIEPKVTVIERVHGARSGPFMAVSHVERVAVLPRDLDDHRDARERVEALAEQYDSVEVDRLPPLGALHWKVTGHKADGTVDVYRVGVHGSLMPWGAR